MQLKLNILNDLYKLKLEQIRSNVTSLTWDAPSAISSLIKLSYKTYRDKGKVSNQGAGYKKRTPLQADSGTNRSKNVSYIHIHLFILHRYITNSQYDQLPVGLTAQLVEHCTGIAEVMGLNPTQPWIFFRLSFCNCLSYILTVRIFLLFNLLIRNNFFSNALLSVHTYSTHQSQYYQSPI